MNELLLLAVLGAAFPGFPRDAGGRIGHAGIGVTVGGAPAVVVVAGEKVTAFRADGESTLFSIGGGEDEAAGAPAAADMDGDGRPEIAVATTSGKLFLWSGGLVSGFPVKLGARVRTGPSFGDVDGDGRPELLLGDEKGRVHAYRRNGRELTGWPENVGCVVTSSASSSGFAGGRSVAVGCEDGKVHVLDASGRERQGFPLVTKFSVTGAPVFADLDDDGEMDLLVASQDFGLYAVNARAQPLPGFPVKAGYRIYEGPALADLDGDRRLDVLFASADGMIHAVSASGEKLSGFPVRAGTRIFGGVAVGDLDRDGTLDAVVATADGSLVAVGARGKPVPGFPSTLSSADVAATPLLIDLAQDGSLGVFVGVRGGRMNGARAAKTGSAPARAPWPGPGGDASRTGRYGPNPPSYKDLALVPAEPRALDAVKATWRGVWLDAGKGESAPAPRIEWQRNGKAVAALEGKKQLPPGTVKRGERWRFVLTSPRGDAVAQGREVAVLDTPPSAPAVALEPAQPNRGTEVRAKLVKQASDPDGDPLAYEITWSLDGAETGVKGEVFPAERLKKSALLVARAVASDGELTGPPGTAQARVGDTPPGPVRIALEPASPGRAEPVRARIEVPAADADGDPLVYRYAWRVDGQPRNLAVSTAALPPALFRKHQKIEAEVRAFDGELAGPPARLAVTARNTPPAAPRVEIRPARPRRGDALRAAITAPAEDVDGDALTYRFAWKKNGAPFAAAGDGREIAGKDVARGDVFELLVTASDGESTGPGAAAQVKVANTPPLPPRIALEPRHPRGGAPIKLVVLEPARDADGERVTLQIAWTRDGKPTGSGAETLPAGQASKHERVRVVVTPRDGEEAGATAVDEVVVDDAPPGEPGIAFTNERPTAGAPLVISVRTPAKDPDGDAVRYQYRWLKDGAPIALPDGTPESREAPFWTTSSEVPTSELKKGQRWTVEVRAHDGERPGSAARATVAIVNAPPPAPRLRLVPERPRRVDGIAVAIEQPPDPDGDGVTYRYLWRRNGDRHEAPADQAQIPRGVAKKGQRWSVEVVASDGEAESQPARLETVIADSPPGPTAVTLCDGPVPGGTVPQARIAVASSDPDADPVTYRHEWTVNGKPVPAMSGQARLASPALVKHDRVRVTVTPWDGELAGPPAFAECAVENTPPTAPTVALEPAEPSAPHVTSVAVRKPSADRDGDAVSYRYAWWRDGTPVKIDGPVVPPGTLRHGEVWRVEVTPFDGEEEGERVALQAVVKNTPPPVPTVVLVPATAAAGESLTCEARAPERDPDQEQITPRYRWLRNEKPEAFGDGSPTLPAGVLRRGDRWRCEGWTFDGTAESGRASAELVVRNTPPPAPQVAIEPEKARKGDDLHCRISAPSSDADDDNVTYAYAWTENDRPVPPAQDPARVDGARVVKGRRWKCTATPSDGTATGAAASAVLVVANSPPGPAVPRLQPTSPRQGQTVRCEVVVKAEDPDGDVVRYRFGWLRNGAPQPFAETSQEIPARLVKAGDRWQCTLTPWDGTEDGPQAGSEEGLVLPSAETRTVDVR